jgi:hypothetical protein
MGAIACLYAFFVFGIKVRFVYTTDKFAVRCYNRITFGKMKKKLFLNLFY